jgi:hypothetical protein
MRFFELRINFGFSAISFPLDATLNLVGLALSKIKNLDHECDRFWQHQYGLNRDRIQVTDRQRNLARR